VERLQERLPRMLYCNHVFLVSSRPTAAAAPLLFLLEVMPLLLLKSLLQPRPLAIEAASYIDIWLSLAQISE